MTTNQEVNRSNEVPVQPGRLCRVLKIALITLALLMGVVLCTLLFTLFETATVSPSDGERAAYAWSLPSGNNVEFTFLETHKKHEGSPSTSLFSAPTGNYAYASGTGSDAVGVNSYVNDAGKNYTLYILYCWDVNLTATDGINHERAGIYSGNITTFSVEMSTRYGNDGFIDGDCLRTYLTGFIVQLDENGKNVGEEACSTEDRGNNVDNKSFSLSIKLSESAAKIRYGLAYKITVRDPAWFAFGATPTMRIESISASAPTVSYSTPTLTVNAGANGQIENANSAGTVISYNEKKTEISGDTASLSSVFARANAGYYFTGWTVSASSTVYTSITFRDGSVNSTAVSGTSLKTPLLTLRTGAYLKAATSGGNITITANFASIPMLDTGTSFTYRQNADFSSMLQGPSIDNRSNGALKGYAFNSGTVNDHTSVSPSTSSNTFYTGTELGNKSYKSSEKPSNYGNYEYTIFIFINGAKKDAETGTDLFLGYYNVEFSISKFPLSGEDVVVSDNISATSTGLTQSFTYSSLAITPSPKVLYARAGSYLYRLSFENDYTISNWSNNTNVTTSAQLTISSKSNSNFQDNKTLSFTIQPIAASDLKVYYGDVGNIYGITTFDGDQEVSGSSNFNSALSKVYSTASDIQSRYKCLYTGYQVRPAVYLVYVWANVLKDVNPSDSGTYEYCNVVFPLIADNSTADFANYYGSDADLSTNKSYFELTQIATGVSSSGEISYIGKFGNNINAATYAELGEDAPYFEITVLGGDVEADATLTVYFDIAPMPVDNLEELKTYFSKAEVTVVAQEDDPAGEHTLASSKIFDGGRLEPHADYVFITVSGIDINIVSSTDGSINPVNNMSVTYIIVLNDSGYTISAVSSGTQIVSKNYGTFTIPKYVDAVYYPALDSPIDGVATGYNASFTVEGYGNNINAHQASGEGAPYIRVTLSGNLSGTVDSLFRIAPKTISNDNIGFDSNNSTPYVMDPIPNQTYTGSALTPAVTVNVTGNRNAEGQLQQYVELTSNDYTVQYSDNVDVTRVATLTVTGKGNYTGSASTTFYIVARAVSDSAFTVNQFPEIVFTGSRITDYEFSEYSTITIRSKSSGEELIVNYLKDSTKEPQFEISAYGANTTVQDSDANNAYFVLTFLSTDVGVGANFSGTLTARFTITPKDIYGLESTTDYQLYYNGKRHTPSDTGALHVYDPNNTLVTEGELKHGSDYVLDTASDKYGENINAGTGTLTVTGIGNYTGTLTITFTIRPLDISGDTTTNPAGISMILDSVDSAGNIVDSSGNIIGVLVSNRYRYYYINAAYNEIRPAVSSVSGNVGSMTEGVDYIVGYGTEDTYDNKNVRSGGAVVLEGIGNYSGKYVLDFDILAINQTAVFDTALSVGGGTSALESDSLAVAAFEITAANMSAGGIRVTAYTSAISTPYVQGRFTLYNLSRNGAALQEVPASQYTVTYATPKNPVSHNGSMMMPTVADITFNTAMTGYYVVTVSFTDTNGNFNSAEPATRFNHELHSVLVKKEDGIKSESSFSADWTYGDGEVRLSPQLNSGTGANVTLSAGTAMGNVIEVVGGNLSTGFTLKIIAAGESELTLRHSGYVNNTDYSEAYTAFSVTKTFTVNKKDLYVYVAGVTEAVYGEAPVFEYEYNGIAAGDAGRVLTGVQNNYGSEFHNVLPEGSGHLVETVRNESFESGPMIGNYSLHYGSYRDYMLETGQWQADSAEYRDYYNLVVTKRTLIVTAHNGTNAAGRITKDYGTDNPATVDFSFSGFGYNDNSNVFTTDANYVAPQVLYAYQSGDGSVAIDRLTGAGTYNITISEGSSTNYIIIGGAQQLVINKVQATLRVEYTSAVYNGEPHPVVYSVGGVEGGTAPIGETVVTYYQSGSALYSAPYHAGTYSVTVRFIADNDPNYTDTSVVWYVSESGTTSRIDTSEEQIGSALVISPAIPVFDYPGGITEVAYNKSGIPLNNLVPLAYAVEGGANPTGEVTITAFRQNGSGDEYDPGLINAGLGLAMLSGGIWDIQFQYTSSNSDYASVGGSEYITLEGKISIAADLVSITFNDISVTYNGNAVSVNEDMFSLHFPDMEDNESISGGAIAGSEEYGTFYFGIVPSDYADQGYEWLIANSVTEVRDSGDYAVWAYYVARAQEARTTGIIIAESVRIARKQLSVKDFVLADGASIGAGAFTYTFDAASHAPVFGTDIILNNSALAAGDLKLEGDVRLTFVKSGQESLSSVFNAGTYNLIINYSPAAMDNYEMSTDNTVLGAVVVLQAPVTLVYDGQTMIVTYNGNGFGITARVEGIANNTPTGTLRYEYRVSGGSVWTSSNPTEAGSYDVRVYYVPAADDNYSAGETLDLSEIIIVNPATPTITITDIEIRAEDLGDFDPIGSSLYTISGAVGDTKPMSGQGNVIVWIGMLSEGSSSRTWLTYNEWRTNYGSSGTYSVRIEFESATANYTDNIQERHNVFVVLNATPELGLESVEYVYDGNRVSAATATVELDGTVYEPYEGDSSGFVYYGSLNYEYSVAGSNQWTATRPSDVGSYSVRVTYTPNPGRDVFASAVTVFENAVVIKPMAIYVLPVYGQGQQYAGSNYGGANLAYMYSYIENGIVYYVYSVVTDNETGYTFGLESAEYTDRDGNVYTVYTGIDPEGDGKAEKWLDYTESVLIPVQGSFVYDGNAYTVELNGEYAGVIEQTLDGKRFVIDLDRDVAYPQSGSVSYTYTTEEGVYLSRRDADGSVVVMKVDTGSNNYTNNADNTADYVTTVSGRTVIIRIDYNTMRASGGNLSYTVSRSVGLFGYKDESSAGKNVSVYVDFAYMSGFDADFVSGVYRAADGRTYLIDTSMSMAVAVAEMNIVSVEIAGQTVAVADMGKGELDNGYNYSYYDGKGKYYIVDLKERTLREANFYLVSESDTELDLGYADDVIYTVPLSELTATRRDNVYYYRDNITGAEFYIDLNTMRARSADNLGTFDLTDPEYATEFKYTVYDASGAAKDRTTLFGKDTTALAPTLPGGVFTGSLSVSAYDAGAYNISAQGIGAGSNFEVNNYAFADQPGFFIKFLVTRIGLEVIFTAPENLVYDGIAKEVVAETEGLIPGERADLRLTYLGGDGEYADNVNVTEQGFYVVATLVNADGNYYLLNDTSDTYFVTPAEMNMPTYDLSSANVVYDGLAHTIVIVPDEGAQVEYVTATRFVEPGTYTIGALVTRPNYQDIYFEATLVINKAVYSVTPAAYTGTLVYGDKLPELSANTDLGYVALDPDQILMPGENSYNWTFYPYDPESFYSRYEGAGGGDIRGTIVLNVGKAQANIEIFTDLEQTETNPLAIVGAINGNSLAATEGIKIEYVDSSGNRYATMPTTAGRYTVVITYEGDELYAETVKEFVLTIEDETNLVWLYYVLGGLTVLTVFSIAFFLMKRGKKYE